MKIALIVTVAALLDMLVGAVIYALIDDKDLRLYRWYTSCPPQIAWFMQPLVLICWPVGVYFWFKQR